MRLRKTPSEVHCRTIAWKWVKNLGYIITNSTKELCGTRFTKIRGREQSRWDWLKAENHMTSTSLSSVTSLSVAVEADRTFEGATETERGGSDVICWRWWRHLDSYSVREQTLQTWASHWLHRVTHAAQVRDSQKEHVMKTIATALERRHKWQEVDVLGPLFEDWPVHSKQNIQTEVM